MFVVIELSSEGDEWRFIDEGWNQRKWAEFYGYCTYCKKMSGVPSLMHWKGAEFWGDYSVIAKRLQEDERSWIVDVVLKKDMRSFKVIALSLQRNERCLMVVLSAKELHRYRKEMSGFSSLMHGIQGNERSSTVISSSLQRDGLSFMVLESKDMYGVFWGIALWS